MGKLGCVCGHTIEDQTDRLPYKGYILPDRHIEEAIVTFDQIDTLIEAIRNDKRQEWIDRNMGSEYPEMENSSLIFDLQGRVLHEHSQDIYECENCGRIAIQMYGRNYYKFYHPEKDDSRGIFQGEA